MTPADAGIKAAKQDAYIARQAAGTPRNKAVVAAVRTIGDSVRYSKATGTYTVKRGFFYRMGYSEDKMAAAIKAAVPSAHIVRQEEHYNAWPRDSYWVVDFQLNQEA